MKLIFNLIRYNIKVIFAGKFGYFLLAAFLFYVFIVSVTVFDDSGIREHAVYYLLIFPGLLLIFYPTVYGIQNDDDSKMLEIIFGIPNYRYKVWLIRIVITFIIIYGMLLILSFLSDFALHRIEVFEMSYELIYPVFFMGSLGFMFSTIAKNGNGTAVILIIIGMLIWITSDIDQVSESYFNVFLNPWDVPSSVNETVWQEITLKNRIFLGVGVIVALLYGLSNLQSREKFV